MTSCYIRKINMKQISLFFVLVLAMVFNANALTYEEAFDSIKAIPEIKGINGTEVSGSNDFTSIGVTDGKLILWNGETSGNTEIYGNKLYAIMSELPVSEMIQCRMYGNSIMAIYAKPISEDQNRIIILSDSAGAGFTGALLGYIDNAALDALRSAIIVPRETGGMAIYYNVMNF